MWIGIRSALEGEDKDLECDWKQLVHEASVCSLIIMTYLHGIFKQLSGPCFLMLKQTAQTNEF
jgi:hypothetical protein